MEYENFNDVKVGDKVYMPKDFGGVLCEVRKVMSKMFYTLSRTFKKENGKEYGGYHYVIHATPEIIERVRKSQERRKLIQAAEEIKRLDFSKFKEQTLKEICRIIADERGK